MVQRLSSEEKINPSLAEIRKQREEIYLSIKEKEIELQELELKELELRRLKINEEELKNRERLENMIIELQERIDLNKKELKNRIQKNQE